MPSPLLTVARWEFFRYFKWKGEIFTLVLILVLSALSFGGKELISQFSSSKSIEIAVIDDLGITLPLPETETNRFIWTQAKEADRSTLMQRLGGNDRDTDLGGILTIKDSTKIAMTVFEKESWQKELQSILNQLLLDKKLETAEISPTDFYLLKKPVALEIQIHEQGNLPSSKSEKIFVTIVLGLMLLGVFMSFSYIFVSVTSEKQMRVTEQVISAISPQTWIDGKLLGLTAMSLKSIITTAISSVLGIIVFIKLTNSPSYFEGFEGSIITFGLIGSFALAGLLFWNCFLIAIAAMVENPNTSTKTPIMLLPSFAVSIAFFAISEPNNVVVQVLSFLPITSMGVMPVRLVMGTVAMWQIIVSLLLLIIAIIWTRKFASKIFRLSMLMYGKEPQWKEVWKWIRQS
ncbi:MAG: ABC transporter permease [Proteobacteria bacterium]|nr:ABC transporter permease [Pseudomonadota bacterium]